MATSKPSKKNLMSEVFVGLAAAPVLLVALGEKALSRAMTELGQASEEIFRGDRLPVLWMPQDTSDNSSDTTDP
jgi:hypothetical protein